MAELSSFDASSTPRFLRETRRIERPGIRTLPVGVERYEVAGAGVLAVRLSGGDTLRVIDVEGGQMAEIIPLRPHADSDAGLFGVSAAGKAEGLRRLLARNDTVARQFYAALAAVDVTVDELVSITRFGADSAAGSDAVFTAAEDAVAVIAAPAEDMAVDGQNPPSPLVVFVERANPVVSPLETPVLPEPLASPRLDLQINRATAAAYEVKAGEWLQIIDVEGRQCTDFQAFATEALERGAERCLDATTSRTLSGHAYPVPGLTSKFYDYDFQPLVEVVQDTCGRHDAFGLACSSKYYDDLGYPGHINCSDNFNAALAPFGVAPRRGWMAMNFFFNTAIAECGGLSSDEPWSRPGDYVLLRALTDLVCVSSACPDDIDPANGWNPTDIHIRTYDKSLRAPRSVLFRKRTDSEGEMTKETGFHSCTSALTRDFVEYNGYWMPSTYAAHGALDEYWACREKAIAIDLSALRKFEVLGPDAETLMQYCLPRDIQRLAIGQVVYSALCYENGTMLDDGTLFRLGEHNFRWIGGCDSGGDWLRQQATRLGLDVRVKTSTDQLHNVSVQGPLSRDILRDVVWTAPAQTALEELKWFRFTIGRLDTEHGTPILVSRTGYTGELGYEVFCHPKDAPTVWARIIEAGEPHGLLPMGLTALDMVRIEAGLIFAGYEFDDQTDPFEAGIGFSVPTKKEEDYIGRDALQRRRENPQRVLVGLELAGDEASAHGDGVYIGRQKTGVITSGIRSPVLKKNIALCRMTVEHSTIGTEVEVGKLDGHQKRIVATVCAFPFYDPEKKRVRV